MMVLSEESLGRPSASLRPAPFSLSQNLGTPPPETMGERLVHKRTVSGVLGKVCGAGKMAFSH